MPAFPDEPRVIDSQAQLDELCEGLTGKTVIAIDTEFVRTDTYFPRLCLIQAAAGSDLACVDVLADLDTGPLRQFLTSGDSLKVFHAAKQDLEAFYSAYGDLPAPIIDTQIAAALIGRQAQIGYGNLVEDILGIKLAKGQTRTDWSRRPLTAAQMEYAADDVRYLPELLEKLRESLESSGRYDWTLEDSAALVDPKLYVWPPDEAWQRMPGIAFMPPPPQARARRLAAWRERRARDSNRPRGWILADKVLIAIADANPPDEAALGDLPGLPAGVHRKQGRAILGEIHRANEDLENGRIEINQVRKPAPPDPKALKRLAGIVGDKASELDVAPELLSTRRDLAALLRGEQDVRALAGWRRSIIGEALLQAL
jgi:ribonuclease D